MNVARQADLQDFYIEFYIKIVLAKHKKHRNFQERLSVVLGQYVE